MRRAWRRQPRQSLFCLRQQAFRVSRFHGIFARDKLRCLEIPAGLNTIWRRPSRKSPCDKDAGAASLVVRRTGTTPPQPLSAADVAVDDVAEQIPLLALELLQRKLGERCEVGGTGIDLDARQQAAEFEILDAGRLLHH